METKKKFDLNEAPKGWAILKMIGPGIVWAGLAIGGGELWTIPRVGSVYGMMFLWMPLLAIVLKYFMLNELGRWTVATGTPIYDGFAMLPGPKNWLNWILLGCSIYLAAVHIGGLVAAIGIITNCLLPFLSAYAWSIIIMISFVILTWTNSYNAMEKVLMVVMALLTISVIVVGVTVFPPLSELAKGFTFQIPQVTPDWAVQNFNVKTEPLAEIIPAIAFAGCGAINSIWYSDWTISKGCGLGKYYDGKKNTAVALNELKDMNETMVGKIKGWYRVMFHDALWGANLATLIVTFFYLLLAIVILNPLQLAPAGSNFVMTLSKTFTETLGPWAEIVYLLGAWGVIYGTMATVYDGYARTINKTIQHVLPNWKAYNKISDIWKYRIWILYGTVANFVLVYMFNAVPASFLNAASWVEGAYLFPIVAFAVAWLTTKKLPELYGEKTRQIIKPKPLFTVGTIVAGLFYAFLICMHLFG